MGKVGDDLLVVLLANGANAGPGAQFDVVIQAVARILSRDLAVAGQVREDTPQHVQRLVHRPHAGIGTVIVRAILHHLARDRHLGEGIVPVNFDVGVTLVIFQADVVVRPVLLDQIHFEDQRFQLGTNHDPLDMVDVAHHLAGLKIQIGTVVEVRANPVAQIDGLAHVDNFTGGVLHQVAARLGGQGIQGCCNFL